MIECCQAVQCFELAKTKLVPKLQYEKKECKSSEVVNGFFSLLQIRNNSGLGTLKNVVALAGCSDFKCFCAALRCTRLIVVSC